MINPDFRKMIISGRKARACYGEEDMGELNHC